MKHKLKVFLFCAVLLVVSVGSVVMPKKTVSYYENRSLAVFPVFSMDSLWSGSYFEAVETYISDHLIARNQLLKLNTEKEMLLRSPVINDIVITPNALLPYHSSLLETYDTDKMKKEIEILSELNIYCKQNGIHFLYVGIPEQSSALCNQYPDDLLKSSYADRSLQSDFFANLEAHKIDFLDMSDVLKADFERFYSKTDHHFNLYGAYECYVHIMKYINKNYCAAPVLTDIQIKPVDVDFLGSRNRKLFGLYPTDDCLYTYSTGENVAFERYDNGTKAQSSVFDEANRDTYNYYMGGDKAETILKTNRSEWKDILIIGDSFTNPLETLFYHSFDETRSLDFRHYQEKSIYEYLKDYKPDIILLVRDDLSYIVTEGNGNLSH